MAAAPSGPNDRLRVLISETGWTYERTARAVAAVAAETGIRVRCDRSAVAHWLAGTRPRLAVAACLLEALSRALGRRIGPGQAGLSVPGSDRGELGESDPLGQLRRLLDAAAGRTMPSLEVYSPAGAIVQGWSARAERRPVSPDAAHVPEAAAALRFFADLDAARGGGHARPVLMSYLAVELADRSPGLGDTLVPLVALAGFTCFDEHRHALAQRFYQIAAVLAAQAGDLDGYVIAVRGLAGQAHALGHHDVALWLIGNVLALDEPTAARFAGLHAYAACAYAATGEFDAALRSLRDAGVALDAAARLAPPPFGGYDHAGLAEATGRVLAARRDLPAAAGALRASLRRAGAVAANQDPDDGAPGRLRAEARPAAHGRRHLAASRRVIAAAALGPGADRDRRRQRAAAPAPPRPRGPLTAGSYPRRGRPAMDIVLLLK